MKEDKRDEWKITILKENSLCDMKDLHRKEIKTPSD